jgi:hypothetical protein
LTGPATPGDAARLPVVFYEMRGDGVSPFWHVFQKARLVEVYNIGGARQANCSMLEAIKTCEELIGRPMNWSHVEGRRIGNHIWWISDVRRFQSHYLEFLRHSRDARNCDVLQQRAHVAAGSG